MSFSFESAGPFSGFTGTNGPSASAYQSLKASLQSEFAETNGATSVTASSRSASTTGKTGSSSATPSSSTPTTLETSTLSPSQDINSATITGADSPTGTGENAASNTTGEAPTVSEKDDCNGISCNPGLQAAIAVPVVIGVILMFALLFFCARRRRRRREAQPVSEKQPLAKKKKWSRHLRVFSFDAELLMGGFRSSSNSVHSRQTGSTRSGESSNRNQSPSIHSVEDVAPPYRDAVTTAQRPIAQNGVAGATGLSPDPFPRPSSTATAPPPYAAAPGNTSRQSDRPTTPVRDPFADTSPISPVEASPFDHPDDDATSPTSATHHGMSRQYSLLHSVQEDGGSTLAGSDAGSLREAQLGRNLSVMSGGRTIDDVRRTS